MGKERAEKGINTFLAGIFYAVFVFMVDIPFNVIKWIDRNAYTIILCRLQSLGIMLVCEFAAKKLGFDR